MSREVSGLRLLLHSPASDQASLSEIGGSQRYLRFGLLLLTVLAGIVGTQAVRVAMDSAVAYLEGQTELVQNTTVVLIASALALVVLGCYRRALEQRRRLVVKKRVFSIKREPSADFWKAQEEERKQISRELHDSVGQLLTANGLQLRALKSNRLLPEEMRNDLEESCRLNAEALRQVRDLAMGLRPALLDDVSMVAALEWQARQFSRQTGISALVEASGDSSDLPEANRVCIYRCVQEALTNCAKHARAKHVRILLSVSNTAADVVIEDDGIGLDEGTCSKGLGLIGMRERVAGARGTFAIATRNQGGTALTVRIPVTGDVLA
ncbi:MAG TPA: sensor histidine kinase [Terriglobales bacterium]|nr:sensor histidine kinase [Terriglobales bacterium]